MRALVIDDSKAMRMILGRLLKEVGFEVSEACHGRDALDKLGQTGAVDLALVDWNMPEMNGLEFVQAVRGDGSFQAMKLMMVTTESEIARVQAAMDAGADEYVMKPFTTESLRDKLTMMGFAA
ncbi:MAG: response regulator [Proteobacteria bacterium]|nr:response regulator [Pseudomonadota bacterium]